MRNGWEISPSSRQPKAGYTWRRSRISSPGKLSVETDETLESTLVEQAYQMSVQNRRPAAGRLHHSEGDFSPEEFEQRYQDNLP
jgi:hypothetical protein